MDELKLNVLLKLTPEQAEALDRVRGNTLRATWVKQLIDGAVEARDRQGAPTDVWVINENERAQLWPTTI